MSGFGVVTPVRSAIELEEPVVIKMVTNMALRLRLKFRQ